jgi:hypothetical protein
MPPQIAFVVALVLASVTAASADEPTRLDRTISTCVGPGFDLPLAPYDVIAGLPEESCIRACEAAAQGCKAVVRAVDQCGLRFLKTVAKTEMEICRGHGFPARECRGVMDAIRSDLHWWKDAGKFEREACDSDTETFCSSRCQPAPSLYESLVPLPSPERPQPEAGGAIDSLIFVAEPPQGGAEVTVVTVREDVRIWTLPEMEAPRARAGGVITSAPNIQIIDSLADSEVREHADEVVIFVER